MSNAERAEVTQALLKAGFVRQSVRDNSGYTTEDWQHSGSGALASLTYKTPDEPVALSSVSEK